ncbi:MAG TPA: DUF1549 domain-containing protein, partial [Isosphaeraceae bacterium]
MCRLWWAVPWILLAARSATGEPDEAGARFFEGTVRPLLQEQCYRCHSAEAETVRGGLRLDSREGLLRGGDGGPALVPGHPERSRLIEAVGYTRPDLQMPPRRRLSRRQVADLVRWVEMGAPWLGDSASTSPVSASASALSEPSRRELHWAWQPVRKPAPPAARDAGWVRSSVDRFILAGLETAGLRPAPEADRRTLLRRVHFALVGLPPTAEEVEAFVADPAPDALEAVVDRLLASPRFGERWARHWMDLVRYSDTLGNEADLPIPNAWRYRDYLVRALNADLPYDRLILEHLAGDLLAEPRRRPGSGDDESVIGTAVFWMNEGKRSPVDLRQAEADAVDNCLDVLGKTFLGLTVACARCHDHKFDPIPQEDYYGLSGYLKSSRYTQAMLNRAELDARAAELAALRARILQAAGEALREQARTLSRDLMADLGVHAAEDPTRI